MKKFWIHPVFQQPRPPFAELIEDAAIAVITWMYLINGLLLMAGVKGPWLWVP